MGEYMEFESIKGKCLKIESEYLDDNGKVPFSLYLEKRENHICIIRKKIKYDISIVLLSNKKSIQIIASAAVCFNDLYEIAMDIIRFENLFEGRFFTIKSFCIDNQEFIEQVEPKLLGYMKGNKTVPYFYMVEDDVIYKKWFLSFQKYLKNKLLRYHVFLYSAFLPGMTADIRIAQLIEIFEPTANELAEEGKIQLIAAPYRVFKNTCKKCGAQITRKIPNKDVYLKDRIIAVVKAYGRDIFVGDSKAKLIRKAVAVRNKVDHVERQRGAMTGPECGLYLLKFSLLYRVIVMEEIGVPYEYIKPRLKLEIEDMNKRFIDYSINANLNLSHLGS